MLRAIFGEKAREVRDTSLRVPHGEAGIVVDREDLFQGERRRTASRSKQTGKMLYRHQEKDQRR